MPTSREKPVASVQARVFCRALAAETAGLLPGSWRMLDTVARRMGVGFFEAEKVAKDCVRLGWVQLEADSVRLEDEGRTVGARGQ